MAAWGNLKNIFEKPATDSHSPCAQNLPSTSSNSSYDIFRELCHSSSSSSPPILQSITTSPEPHSGAAVEIFGELCYAEKSDFYPCSDAETEKRSSCEKVGECVRSYSDVRPRIAGFPPPISTIGSGGKPRVYFKSIRKDGRFVLREIRIPKQRLLQTRREDGRLKMRVLRPREEEEEEEMRGGGEEG
ncbi:uncharacterized protein LOC110027966 [Phalaenopsis equestris]|uniref:uncharacterized protein LOC110027966 n=1 Tax=Phalaenopsis equestris TaxID=78828 RepID=UPI0009E57125|nr:uncharacterized protein LOC110027966 [Phalaenopsis equestris]